MNINPNLSAVENVIALVTNPALGLPVNPEYLACGAPVPYDPHATVGANAVYGPGLNVDGNNSNTQVVVYERPSLEDVTEDGVSQRIMYQRKTLAQAVGATPLHVTLKGGTSATTMLQSLAAQMGLIAEEIFFNSNPYQNAPTLEIGASGSSLVYMLSLLTVTVAYN